MCRRVARAMLPGPDSRKEPHDVDQEDDHRPTSKRRRPRSRPARRPRSPRPRPKDNKTTALIELLTKGATVEHMAKALGWLPHTLRAALSRLKTKEGLKIERERVDGTTSYRIA